MINQHQFQQSAKHYRSGRISLSEFQARVFEGFETKPQKIQQGNTNEILADTIGQLKEACQPAVVTGVSGELGQQLSQQFADGEFDSKANTFTCNTGTAQEDGEDNLAVVVIVNVGEKFKTGHLAGLVAAHKPKA